MIGGKQRIIPNGSTLSQISDASLYSNAASCSSFSLTCEHTSRDEQFDHQNHAYAESAYIIARTVDQTLGRFLPCTTTGSMIESSRKQRTAKQPSQQLTFLSCSKRDGCAVIEVRGLLELEVERAAINSPARPSLSSLCRAMLLRARYNAHRSKHCSACRLSCWPLAVYHLTRFTGAVAIVAYAWPFARYTRIMLPSLLFSLRFCCCGLCALPNTQEYL